MALLKQLKEGNTKIYPVTHAQGVFIEDTTLDQYLDNIKLGEENVDLTNYYNKSEVDSKLEEVIPNESTVSEWGFTKNQGTITGIKMNGSDKGTSGIVDLGTVVTNAVVSQTATDANITNGVLTIPALMGKDGEKGDDGISVTHSWEGTTLTITSASGTSSADLKGDKGDDGRDGTFAYSYNEENMRVVLTTTLVNYNNEEF